MNILKKCPHCGGYADLVARYDFNSNDDGELVVMAECQICGARSKSVKVSEDYDIDDLEVFKGQEAFTAQYAWNMRYHDAEQDS